jgi:hypothetical protein
MARSIHTTRKDVAEHERDDHGDTDEARAESQRLRAELRKKRRIKAQVDQERRHELPDGVAVVDPASIPIVVEDESEHVHHPLSAADVVAVLRRLPPGVADGLSSITLSLGRGEQDLSTNDDPLDPDPFTDRPSIEILSGVFTGRVLGCYYASPARIVLCAYVHAPDLPLRSIKATYLKLRAAATLVHEVAHHHDFSERVRRGRWLADDSAQTENYAERREHEWIQSVVLPYLEEDHAEAVAHLRAWLREHGGADLPLDFLVDDPRVTNKNGTVAFRWGVLGAFETLLEDVASGGDPLQVRVGFAESIHFDGEYEIPRTILAGVLAQQPGHVEALTLLGDIDVHEEKFGDAEAHARAALAGDPRHCDAWEVLVDALYGQRRWADVVEAATSGIACAEARHRIGAGWMLRSRARAYLELDEHAAAERDMCGLALGRPIDQRVALALRAMQLFRQDRLVEALALANAWLEAKTRFGFLRREVEHVHAEATHRLGQ